MKTIIIGAGLTGLGLAYFLEKEGEKDYLILESESEIGGWCKTIRKNGFAFDLAPHLLHIKDLKISQLINELLENKLFSQARKGGIFFQGKIIPYPFQYNLYHLDDVTKKECLDSAIESHNKFQNKKPINFEEFILINMGGGIARHFMIPYNKKYYCVEPNELTFDFFEKYMSSTKLEDIKRGAISDMSNSEIGFFKNFLYTKEGGIDYLPKAFSEKINNIKLNEKIVKIDIYKKIIFTKDKEYKYENLVSTIPLPEIINLIENVPEEIKIASKKLRCTSMSLVFLGINRPKISEHHWLYFPQEDIFQFRNSFPMNFSEKTTPQGMNSICAEYSYIGEKKFSDEEIINKTIDDLIKIGIIKNKEEIIFKDICNKKYGYVIFDFNRTENLKLIQNYLRENKIYPIGRYGVWEHSSMDEVIIQAKEIVPQLI